MERKKLPPMEIDSKLIGKLYLVKATTGRYLYQLVEDALRDYLGGD